MSAKAIEVAGMAGEMPEAIRPTRLMSDLDRRVKIRMLIWDLIISNLKDRNKSSRFYGMLVWFHSSDEVSLAH